jgi:XTP/dITP diphosphohydrolase
MDLIFATHNNNKSFEISDLLGDGWMVKSLSEAGMDEQIPETGDTLEFNALQKARFVYGKMGVDCFADDTGLEIEALNGAPGVYSARYAGPQKDSHQNMQKVLDELEGVANRKARFRTIIALIKGGLELLFEGIVAGEILHEQTGDEGFGYDPIFKPCEAEVSFAEMPLARKNEISHRGKAVRKLVDYLKHGSDV